MYVWKLFLPRLNLRGPKKLLHKVFQLFKYKTKLRNHFKHFFMKYCYCAWVKSLNCIVSIKCKLNQL